MGARFKYVVHCLRCLGLKTNPMLQLLYNFSYNWMITLLLCFFKEMLVHISSSEFFKTVYMIPNIGEVALLELYVNISTVGQKI